MDDIMIEGMESPSPYPGASYRAYLTQERREVPASLKFESYRNLGSEKIDANCYTSNDFFKLEEARLWPKVWQMVCREEDLRQPGDQIVYDLINWSFIIVRTKDMAIKAFYNSCLHRGRKLKTRSGRSANIACPYHAFTWNLDGGLDSIPCAWDFEHLEGMDMSLPEVRVDTWAGFVFINMDDTAVSLHEYLGVLPEHFARWKLEDCVKIAHVAKIMHANWKVVQEAFLESLHVRSTHSKLAPFTGDTNAAYDLWGPNINRSINPMGVPSPHLAAIRPPTEQKILDKYLQSSGRPSGEQVLIPDGVTARQFIAEMYRQAFNASDGFDYSAATDSEMVDAFIYNVFPNFSPWGGFLPNLVYRFRPNGRDVDSCIMEVMILKRFADKSIAPECLKRTLSDAESWSDAVELGALGAVLDEDNLNIPHMQDGMRASKAGKITLSNYQEVRIRHFHNTLNSYVNPSET